MVKKYTLTVPDELGDKIDQHKAEFNLSEVFRAAIGAEIEKKENFKRRIAEDNDMEQIIARLRQEKQQAAIDYNEKGKIDGLQWAKAASYADLQYALRFNPWEPGTGALLYALSNAKGISDYFINTITGDPLTCPDDDDEYLNEHAEKWLEGWLEGVTAFWNQIEDKI